MEKGHAELREHLFTIRMSAEEVARFDRVAAHYGLNRAGAIRMLMKREDDALAAPRGARRAASPVKKRTARGAKK